MKNMLFSVVIHVHVVYILLTVLSHFFVHYSYLGRTHEPTSVCGNASAVFCIIMLSVVWNSHAAVCIIK